MQVSIPHLIACHLEFARKTFVATHRSRAGVELFMEVL
jgi:hypothetical protein